jgi:hypothetical protein
LAEDLVITDQSMSYDGSATKRATVPIRDNPLANNKPAATTTSTDWPKLPDGAPDFAKMTSPQRRAYDIARLAKKFG